MRFQQEGELQSQRSSKRRAWWFQRRSLRGKSAGAACGTGFVGMDPQRRVCQCPRKCGEGFCSALCVAEHSERICIRADFFAPKFGERFSGPRYPLTKACGLAGIAIQKPLDKLVRGDPCDIFSEKGKARLAEAEADPALKAEHWAPECRTFSGVAACLKRDGY